MKLLRSPLILYLLTSCSSASQEALRGSLTSKLKSFVDNENKAPENDGKVEQKHSDKTLLHANVDDAASGKGKQQDKTKLYARVHDAADGNSLSEKPTTAKSGLPNPACQCDTGYEWCPTLNDCIRPAFFDCPPQEADLYSAKTKIEHYASGCLCDNEYEWCPTLNKCILGWRFSDCPPQQADPYQKNKHEEDVEQPNHSAVGTDVDEHGCLGSGGYEWCATLNECIRTWETECPDISSPGSDLDEYGCLGSGGYEWCPTLNECIRTWETECPGLGSDVDEHGCLGSGGYEWCPTLNECIRTWETECPDISSPGSDLDEYGCLGSGGYEWCPTLNECIRTWETECPGLGSDVDEHGCLGSGGYEWCPTLNECIRTWETECPGVGRNKKSKHEKNKHEEDVEQPNHSAVGTDVDEHGCLGSGGYEWCATLNECIRTWETECPLAGSDMDEHGCVGSAGYEYCDSTDECIRPWEKECPTCLVSAGYSYCDVLGACIRSWETDCNEDPCNTGSTGHVFCPETGSCIASWEESCGETPWNKKSKHVDHNTISDWTLFSGPSTIRCHAGRCNVSPGCEIWLGTYSIAGPYLPDLDGDYVLPDTCQAQCESCQQVPGSDTDGNGCTSSAGYVYCDVLDSCIRPWMTECSSDPCNSGSTGLVFCPERDECIASWETSCGPTPPWMVQQKKDKQNEDAKQQPDHFAVGSDSVESKRHDDDNDVQQGLHQYFDALQVVLGYEPPPSEPSELKQMMAPFVKEVQFALGTMHPGFDKELVSDDVVVHQLANIAGKKKNANDNNRRKLADSDLCLEKTRDVLSMGMRLAYYGLYGDLHNSDIKIQESGKKIAEELDVEEARERLKMLGPLQKGEEEYKLIAKEVFKLAETDIGLGGMINYGMKNWDANNFWATGIFASEMWASALQVSVFDTFPVSDETFSNPDVTMDDTIYNEFAKLVDSYNSECLTCPTGWTDNGLSAHGLHCTAGWTPTCDEKCAENACGTVKGKWESLDLEVNPYTCYLKACPTGWKSLGSFDPGMMCTMTRSIECDESCAQTQCSKVGGSFPLSIDDVADNPYVCYV